jgi:PAS domain S-box-containing protein
MSKKRSRGLSYYFTVNLGTIQGRITFPFVLIMITAFLLIFGVDYFWRGINQDKDFLLRQVKPVAIESVKLSNILHKSQYLLHQYLILKETSYELANKELWSMQVENQKAVFRGVIRQLNDKEADIIFNRLITQIKDLQVIQEKTIIDFDKRRNEKIARYRVKNDLSLALREVDKSLDNLVALAQEKETLTNNNISNQKTQFYWVISLSFIVGFIACYAVGLQMFASIFKWMRELRDKYRDISYGNLPEPFAPKHNEFRNIAQNTNLLIENLKALRNYAIEVGKGNFSLQTKIFGSNSAIGRSLTEMGLSLQRVYNEERTRNWVTEGLADFSEIMRANSHNIDELCRESISYLVKHIEAIQGGFFIVNRDESEVFFELKASFAYGKQKFNNRRLSLNEGLLGRVYNEREKVYLNDLPANYIEVSSGLGGTKPKTLILLPLINEESIMQGVIELASFKEFEDYQVDFLEKLCSSAASTITVVLATQKNQKLLEESQKIAENLRQQEELSRQTAVELNLLREGTEQELNTALFNFEKLKKLIYEIPEAVLIFNQEGRIEFFNDLSIQIFGYEDFELNGRQIKTIFPDDFTQNHPDPIGGGLVTQAVGIRKKVEAIKKNGAQILLNISWNETEINGVNYWICLIREV